MESTNYSSNNPPENNLIWAIVSTILCCIPFGVVAIIKATKVNQLWAQGDFSGAQKAADDAKKWAIWGAIIGPILVILFYVFFFIILGLGSAFINA